MRTLIKKKTGKYTDHMNHLIPFFGVGDISIETTSLNEIKASFGKPEKDFFDDRQNRIVEYSENGIIFKFLKVFNEDMLNPIVSFITVRKPFFDGQYNGIYPGLDKKKVHTLMGNNKTIVTNRTYEIWENKDDKKMKMVYDKNDKLKMIIFF